MLFPVGTLNLILCSASITFREINLNKSMRSIVCVHDIYYIGLNLIHITHLQDYSGVFGERNYDDL